MDRRPSFASPKSKQNCFAIRSLLNAYRDRVHSRHEAFDDAEIVVDNLGERREAVRRARGVANIMGAHFWTSFNMLLT